MSREDPGLRLRVPAPLLDRIRAVAETNHRSMNSEIVARLEASFEANQQIAPAFAKILQQHIDAEVSSRLRAIAAKIGGEV